jgi:tripartite-type tricarboxylate transporter receptor subunit TctC
MRFSSRSFSLVLSAALSLGIAPHQAQAQPAYPNKPIRLVVPFGAGSAPDVLARVLAQGMADSMAATVTVENVPGAGGTIGVDRVAKSAPDGYTLVVAGDAASVLSGGNYGINPPYDTLRDLAPIAQLAVTPNVLVVPSDLPVRTVQELVALVRSQPGKFSYSSGGIGLSQHRAGELMNSMAGLDMVHVPSPTNSLIDLRAGRVQVLFSNIVSALPLASEGKVRALAVTSPTRSPVAPELPTMSESGLPGFEALAWFGLLAPAATPPAILQRLEAEAQKALTSTAMKERLTGMGALPGVPTADAFSRVIRDDIRRWAPKAGSANAAQKS